MMSLPEAVMHGIVPCWKKCTCRRAAGQIGVKHELNTWYKLDVCCPTAQQESSRTHVSPVPDLDLAQKS